MVKWGFSFGICCYFRSSYTIGYGYYGDCFFIYYSNTKCFSATWSMLKLLLCYFSLSFLWKNEFGPSAYYVFTVHTVTYILKILIYFILSVLCELFRYQRHFLSQHQLSLVWKFSWIVMLWNLWNMHRRAYNIFLVFGFFFFLFYTFYSVFHTYVSWMCRMESLFILMNTYIFCSDIWNYYQALCNTPKWYKLDNSVEIYILWACYVRSIYTNKKKSNATKAKVFLFSFSTICQ